MHIVKNRQLIGHFFAWRYKDKICQFRLIKNRYVRKQYAFFRFCLRLQGFEKSNIKNKAVLQIWYFFHFFQLEIIQHDAIIHKKWFVTIFYWNFASILKRLKFFHTLWSLSTETSLKCSTARSVHLSKKYNDTIGWYIHQLQKMYNKFLPQL